MSMRAHKYIGLSPITTRGSVPFEHNHYMHIYGCGACIENCTLSPHRARSFMTYHCTSHFDSMGGIHAYTCMCVCSKCIMHVIPKQNNNPLLSQINLSCCQAKSSDDIADNRLSGCERTTTTTLHVGQTYIC